MEFSKIPLMIVDAADITSNSTDKNGNSKKQIDLNQFFYYEVVKCNRPEFQNDEAQKNVNTKYKEWGCLEAADLNCDIGRQWLALYTVKSPAKGDPILADSLTYQTGSDAMPSGCTQGLHFFCYDYALNIGDMAYSYNNDNNGIYFFWDSDAKAFTASPFTGGQLALAGFGGLAVGILGASFVLAARKKKNDTPEAPAVA